MVDLLKVQVVKFQIFPVVIIVFLRPLSRIWWINLSLLIRYTFLAYFWLYGWEYNMLTELSSKMCVLLKIYDLWVISVPGSFYTIYGVKTRIFFCKIEITFNIIEMNENSCIRFIFFIISLTSRNFWRSNIQ